MDRYLQANATLWDNWTILHATSDYYDVAAFKAGKSTLTSIELEELGDVSGQSLLHLQCHFGLDTLSWARRGARVTGVDFSGRAIELARSLAAELEIVARFVQSNIYDLPAVLDHEVFDIVFTSYGVLSWLPDLRRWAEVVAHFLAPGGTFFIVEHHPFASIFDSAGDNELRAVVPYFPRLQPETIESYGSYATSSGERQGIQYNWRHPLSEIINAVLAAGLRLESVHEYSFTEFPEPGMERGRDGRWRLPGERDGMIPLLFSLKAMK